MTAPSASERRLGVYVCYCGGNISDYVDVERVVLAVAHEPGVVISRTHMFTCSDAAQQEIIKDIEEQKLNGLVIASCSPKLHLFTFRGMAERAGINPYQYVQVNLREQCSWAHNHNRAEATAKGMALVKAGIAKSRLAEPLFAIRVNTKPNAVVVGAGVAGLNTALALADLGLQVDVVEKSSQAGGWTAEWKKIYPRGQDGREVAAELIGQVRAHANIRLHLGAEIIEKTGNLGDFAVKIATPAGERTLTAGAIVVATGFEPYAPPAGEYGFGLPNVLTLQDFKKMLAPGAALKTSDGREAQRVVFIYCVGSRQKKSEARPNANTHCSRYCCTAAAYAATCVQEISPGLTQYHLFRDVRTYGQHELAYEAARDQGAVYIRFDESTPPEVAAVGTGLRVKVKDQLTSGEELEIPADLVVLVSGMQPRENEKLMAILKVPVDRNGFFKEIHPKLRPVETVLDGLFIAGAAQSPRLISEAVASALAAAGKTGALLKKGYVDLEPMIGVVRSDVCSWCGLCQPVCPYHAIEKTVCDGKEVATIIPFLCKGCGACVPICPVEAIDVKGYTDGQIRAAITALASEVGV